MTSSDYRRRYNSRGREETSRVAVVDHASEIVSTFQNKIRKGYPLSTVQETLMMRRVSEENKDSKAMSATEEEIDDSKAMSDRSMCSKAMQWIIMLRGVSQDKNEDSKVMSTLTEEGKDSNAMSVSEEEEVMIDWPPQSTKPGGKEWANGRKVWPPDGKEWDNGRNTKDDFDDSICSKVMPTMSEMGSKVMPMMSVSDNKAMSSVKSDSKAMSTGTCRKLRIL